MRDLGDSASEWIELVNRRGTPTDVNYNFHLAGMKGIRRFSSAYLKGIVPKNGVQGGLRPPCTPFSVRTASVLTGLLRPERFLRHF